MGYCSSFDTLRFTDGGEFTAFNDAALVGVVYLGELGIEAEFTELPLNWFLEGREFSRERGAGDIERGVLGRLVGVVLLGLVGTGERERLTPVVPRSCLRNGTGDLERSGTARLGLVRLR